MKREGFSLLELTMVLVIVALLAGMVALRMHGPTRQCTVAELTAQIVQTDLLAREYAVEQNRCVHLMMDLNRGSLCRMDEQERNECGRSFALPRQYRFSRGFVRGEEIASGTTTVAIGPGGESPTYALLLEGPDSFRRWIVFAGLTGESWITEEDEPIQNMFEALAERTDTR